MKLTAQELATVAERTLGHYDRSAEAFWQGTRDHDVSQNVAAQLRHVEAAAAERRRTPGPPAQDCPPELNPQYRGLQALNRLHPRSSAPGHPVNPRAFN